MSDRCLWAEQCHECGETHSDWEKTGSHAVNGPYHAGTVEHWECGRCGATTEVARR